MRPGRLGQARVALALAGFLVAVLAAAFNDGRLGWAAIVLLGASLLLRLRQRSRHPRV